MRVLSLFDGMACGMLAMQAAGIPVDRYVAFEIDKYAVQTSSHNFPMIEHRGDVFQADFTEFYGFDFLVGGSPCTYWSIAQKNNRETEASGMGWELFSQYVRALREAKPRWFIYENNKSMSKAIRESITQTFGFEPICINSALVSAQNRQRLYWVGKRNPDGTYSKVHVEQPEDRGILLKDVLDGNGRELSKREVDYMFRKEGRTEYGYIQKSTEPKAKCITANISKGVPYNCLFEKISDPVASTVLNINPSGKGINGAVGRIDAKSRCLTTNKGEGQKIIVPVCEPVGTTKDGKSYCLTAGYANGSGENIGNYAAHTLEKGCKSMAAEPVSVRCRGRDGVGKWEARTDGKTYTVYQVKDGQITVKGKSYPIKLVDGFYIIRKLTVSECKRLQTVPEWYEFPVSDTQAYKMLGNGWTVLVICHLIAATQNDVVVSTQNDASDCEQMNIFKMVEGGDDMSYFRTGDPLDDFNRLDREQAKWLEGRPKCKQCGKPIQDEEAYHINGEFICENCMDENKVCVDDYCD